MFENILLPAVRQVAKGHEHKNGREIEEKEESGSRTQNNSENKCVFSNNVMYFTILTLLAHEPDVSTLEENTERKKRIPEREKEEQQV